MTLSKKIKYSNTRVLKSTRFLRNILPVILLIFTIAYGAADDAVNSRITVLYTADLHGAILPLYEYDGERNTGGLLKCAALIRKLRKESENVILVDCGDTFQGSTESGMSRGMLMARALKYLNYDCFVLGNHEFDWGAARARELYDVIQAPVLAANARVLPGADTTTMPNLEPFIIKNIDGVNIALIGLTTPNIPNWFPPEYIDGLDFDDSVGALRRVMPMVRSRDAHIIIVLAHQGYLVYGDNRASQINEIARKFPDIDIIIGAHTHQPVESEIINGILYSQPGAHGTYVGKAELVYDRKAKKLVGRTTRLIKADETIETDAILETKLETELKKTQAHLREKVGTTVSDITGTAATPGQSSVQTLIAASISEVSGADVVIHGTLSRANIPAGSIYARHVWGIVPYDNRIGVVMLDKNDLKAVLEENAGYINSWRFKGVYGLTYSLEKDISGAWLVSEITGKKGKLAPGERVSVAVNSYDLASAGGRLPILREKCLQVSAEFKLLPLETRDAVFKYIEQHSPLNIAPAHGAVIK